MDKVNQYLVSLYTEAQKLDLNQFMPFALESLQEVLDFDCAKWGTGRIENGHAYTHKLYPFNVPEEAIEIYLKVVGQEDTLVQHTFGNPGKTALFTDLLTLDEWFSSPMYLEYGARFGMDLGASTAIIDEDVGHFYGLGIFRAGKDNNFSEEERAVKQLAMPHIVEAFKINRFFSLKQCIYKDGLGNSIALVDSVGAIYDIEPNFKQLLRQEWPDWSGARLPEPLSNVVQKLNSPSYEGDACVFSVTPQENFFLISARKRGILDSLSKRQREIAERYANGASSKAIAQSLDISPSTVNNHLNAIYEKLEVSDKAQLSSMMNRYR